MKPIIIRGIVGEEDYYEVYTGHNNKWIKFYKKYIQKLNKPTRHGHKNREPAKIYIDELLNQLENKLVTIMIVVEDDITPIPLSG